MTLPQQSECKHQPHRSYHEGVAFSVYMTPFWLCVAFLKWMSWCSLCSFLVSVSDMRLSLSWSSPIKSVESRELVSEVFAFSSILIVSVVDGGSTSTDSEPFANRQDIQVSYEDNNKGRWLLSLIPSLGLIQVVILIHYL